MIISNLIEIIKIELDYRENMYENLICIKNNTKDDLLLVNENKEYTLLITDIITIKFSNINFNLEIFNKFNNSQVDDIHLNFSLLKISGIGENSFLESPVNKKKVKYIEPNDIIYDNNLNNLKIKCILIFKINNNNSVYPIVINKDNCGLTLPYENFIMGINDTIRIKNTFIKGRQFFLNKKACKFKFNDIKLYNIVTEQNNPFLTNGFIYNSYDINNLLN
jgi:hypothetical protein